MINFNILNILIIINKGDEDALKAENNSTSTQRV